MALHVEKIFNLEIFLQTKAQKKELFLPTLDWKFLKYNISIKILPVYYLDES